MRYDALFHHHRLQREEPLFVVAGAQIGVGRHPFDGVPELIEMIEATHGPLHDRPHLALPARVEDGLILLGDDRPKPMHSAHVVDAVHWLDYGLRVPDSVTTRYRSFGVWVICLMRPGSSFGTRSAVSRPLRSCSTSVSCV